MSREDNQEVHGRVLNDSTKDPWYLVALEPRNGRNDNDHQKYRSVCVGSVSCDRKVLRKRQTIEEDEGYFDEYQLPMSVDDT